MSQSEQDHQLDNLFRSYRSAVDYGDAHPNFMPRVWERIDARRANTVLFRRVARIFATGSAALAILVATAVSFAVPVPSDDSWGETLASDNLARVSSFYEPVHLDEPPDSSPSVVK